jgi:hypothetical protein
MGRTIRQDTRDFCFKVCLAGDYLSLLDLLHFKNHAFLINPVTSNWDEQLVIDTFNEHDARLILSMPVSANVEDFIAWHFDDRGMHSVKQAYKLQVQLVENVQNGGALWELEPCM